MYSTVPSTKPLALLDLCERGHAEIEHLHPVRIAGLPEEEKIVRLDVAMDDPGGVRRRQAGGGLAQRA